MHNNQINSRWHLGLALVLGLICSGSVDALGQEAKLKKTQGAQIQNDKSAAKSQVKVSTVASETKTIVDEYRATLRKIENTRIYNEQMKKLIGSQDSEMISIRSQIEEIKNTNKEIFPLMGRMISNLEDFIQLDVPFLNEERNKRLNHLKTMMNKAKVSTSEKFRRIVEAYQIENEYGRTIEAYRGKQIVDGKDLTVDFLRTGRLSLVYQTLDGKKQGQWDQVQKKWLPLSSGYRKSILMGLKMARKQTAPSLLTLPVSAPQEVQIESI